MRYCHNLSSSTWFGTFASHLTLGLLNLTIITILAGVVFSLRRWSRRTSIANPTRAIASKVNLTMILLAVGFLCSFAAVVSGTVKDCRNNHSRRTNKAAIAEGCFNILAFLFILSSIPTTVLSLNRIKSVILSESKGAQPMEAYPTTAPS